LLEPNIEHAGRETARLGDQVGHVEARGEQRIELLLQRPGDRREHREAAVLELGIPVVAQHLGGRWPSQ
jgi:hypothetical protein